MASSKLESKVTLLNEAIINSSVAIRKGAFVSIVDGKISYTIQGNKTSGTYTMISSYKEILFMLHTDYIKKIIAL